MMNLQLSDNEAKEFAEYCSLKHFGEGINKTREEFYEDWDKTRYKPEKYEFIYIMIFGVFCISLLFIVPWFITFISK